MENAAFALAKEVRKNVKKRGKILGVCGSGNNAADVIAALRMLSGDFDCELFLALKRKNDMLKIQLSRAKKLGVRIVSEIGEYDCILDGIFGSGLNRELDEGIVNLINLLNAKTAYKIACDIPSGLDWRGNSLGAVFRADCTISMGARKACLYSDFAKDFTGRIRACNLGLAKKNFEGETDIFKLEKSDIRLPFRTKSNVNKGDFGHLFILSGELSGAAKIAAKSALAIGAGLVSIVSKDEISHLDCQIMQSKIISEKMSFGAVGMGLGRLQDSPKNELFEILKSKKALVIDADLCYEPMTIELLKAKKEIIITPHPKEFASLLKMANLGEFSVEEIQADRFGFAKIWSENFQGVLVLKGANTLIACCGKIYIMPYGTAALAKAGSGDVLSGIIAGLISQGYEALQAAITGTLAHALSALKSRKNNYSLTPKDIIKGIQCLGKK